MEHLHSVIAKPDPRIRTSTTRDGKKYPPPPFDSSFHFTPQMRGKTLILNVMTWKLVTIIVRLTITKHKINYHSWTIATSDKYIATIEAAKFSKIFEIVEQNDTTSFQRSV
jgi:hypothetical protein